jgi:hypothetical protein
MSLTQSNLTQSNLTQSNLTQEKENTCGICMIPLKKKYGLKKIIHKCDKEQCEWKHEFHITCINKWINMCINTGEGTYPKCPTCNNFCIPIDKIPEKLRSKAETIWSRDFSENIVIEEEEYVEDIAEEEEEEEDIAEEEDEDEEYNRAHYRLDELLSQHTSNSYFPFLGIVICINGEIITKYLNSYLNLKITNTLRDLKNIVLNDNVNIAKNIGVLNPVKLKLQYWLGSSYPSFRVKDLYYCIPPYLKRFSQLKSDYNLNIDDDILLADLYLEYQYNVGKIMNNDSSLINNEETPLAYEYLEKVYFRKKLRWNGPTGPDDYGHFDQAFSNEENDYIPRNYRAYSYDRHSTINSLAWLTLELAVEDL